MSPPAKCLVLTEPDLSKQTPNVGINVGTETQIDNILQ